MTGASTNHSRIVLDAGAELSSQSRERGCEVFVLDMKVRLPGSNKFFYPDVTAVRGGLQYHDDRKDIITNPVLVIEVLSPSTEAFDRGAKFQAYRTIGSLKEYLLVSQDKPLIEQFVRDEGGEWRYKAAEGVESSLALPSIECTLNLAAVYKRVEF